MANKERHIKPSLKRQLMLEAGGKCANPGCGNWRTHIHHIKHWHVYKAHDAKHMIAICPTCHDAVHHGRLAISDESLYAWKAARPTTEADVAPIYIEPAQDFRVLMGSLAVTTVHDRAVLIRLSNRNQLTFRVLDGDLLQLSARLCNQENREVFRVSDNIVRVQRDKDVLFDFHPGRARVTVPASDLYLPDWIIQQMRVFDPKYAADGRLTAFDLQVVRPGVARVEGMWPVRGGAFIVTSEGVSWCVDPHMKAPATLMGHGESTILKLTGSVTMEMFAMPGAPKSPT